MGTRLIIKNADFSKIGINISIPMIVEVAANQTITVNKIAYTAGGVDTLFEFKDAVNMTEQYDKIKSIKYSVRQIGSANDPLNNNYFGGFSRGITEKVDISSCDKVYLSQYAFYRNPVQTFKGFEKVVLGIDRLNTMLHASSINHKLICGALIEGTSFRNLFCNCNKVPEIDCSSINIITNCQNMFYNDSNTFSDLHTINFANADFSHIDISNTNTYSDMFNGASNLTKIIVTNCNTTSKNFLINRLADAGFTFTESESGVLTKTI